MKYIKSNFKEHKISVNEKTNIKHNLDLYYMFEEYNNECEKILVKIKELNDKLDQNENEVMDYTDHKNRLISENEFSKICIDLRKSLDDGLKNREEFTELIKKFNAIDNTNDTKLKNQLINELDTKDSYRKYKNNIVKANEFNEKFIENVTNKIEEIEENFNIVGEDTINVNSDVIKDFNKKISSINAKIARNKDSISKNNNTLKGLVDELDKILKLNGYENVNVYKNYLHNLNFIVKKY